MAGKCGPAAALGPARSHRFWQRIVLAGSLLLVALGLLAGPAQAGPITKLVSGPIMALGPPPVPGSLGTVTVSTVQGPFTFLVTAQTVILRNGQPATFNSLRVGDFCKAAVIWNGNLWVASQIWDTSGNALKRAAAMNQARLSMPASYRVLYRRR
jgi:hypothetical protein